MPTRRPGSSRVVRGVFAWGGFSVILLMSVVLIGLPTLGWAAEATPKPEAIDLLGELVRIGGYLLMLIILGVLTVQVSKRVQPRLGAGGPIRLLGGRNLAPGAGVRLIQVGSRTWLVSVTRDRIELLAEVEAGDLESLEDDSR